MTAVVHWLGGWASSLECWKSQLQEKFPGWEHRFLDTHQYFSKSPVEAGLGRLPKGHVAAAWSMGSLLAHHWIGFGKWPVELPLLSLCPIFHFVGADGIAVPVLNRMKSKLELNREMVLQDFWIRLPGSKNSDLSWEKAWGAGTGRHSSAQLMEGLDFLKYTVVDPEKISSPPIHWEILAGESDTLAPPGAWENALSQVAKITRYPGGHLPFHSDPSRISESLERLLG